MMHNRQWIWDMQQWDPALARYSRRFLGTEALELGERVAVELFHPQTKANLKAWLASAGYRHIPTTLPADDGPGQIGLKI